MTRRAALLFPGIIRRVSRSHFQGAELESSELERFEAIVLQRPDAATRSPRIVRARSTPTRLLGSETWKPAGLFPGITTPRGVSWLPTLHRTDFTREIICTGLRCWRL